MVKSETVIAGFTFDDGDSFAEVTPDDSTLH